VKNQFLNYKKNKPEKQASIGNAVQNVGNMPWEIDFIKYERLKLDGAVWHKDSYATFGTAIVFLQDTTVGRLHIKGVDLPEVFNTGDIIIVDPNTLHKVTKARRMQDRVVVTFVM